MRWTLLAALGFGLLTGGIALLVTLVPPKHPSPPGPIVGLSFFAIVSPSTAIAAVLVAWRRCEVVISGDHIMWRDLRKWHSAQLERGASIRVAVKTPWELWNWAWVALTDSDGRTRWLDLTTFALPDVRRWIATTFNVEPGSLEIVTSPSPSTRTAPRTLAALWRFSLLNGGVCVVAILLALIVSLIH
jgi:phytoene dehydrogenase-like protein